MSTVYITVYDIKLKSRLEQRESGEDNIPTGV